MRIYLLLAGLATAWLLGCEGEEEPVIATGIQVSPEAISLNAGEEATLEIKTIPGGIAQWSVFDKPEWLSLSQEEGTINGSTTLTLTSNADGLEPDTYTGTIGIFSTAGQATAEVTLFVEADPQLALSATEINFPVGVSENTLQITNEGLGALNYTFSSDISWLTIEPSSGTLVTAASQEITLTVGRTYIVAGTYNGVITLSSNADHGDKTIPVMIEVPEVATISSDLDTVGFNYFVDGQQFVIQNDGNVTYDYSVTSQNNLVTISNSTGSLEMSKNTTLSLTAVRDGLGTGVFTDVLTISNNKGESIVVKIGLLNYVEEKWLVDGTILDAEYDRNKDVIIAVSSQALRIIDPVLKTENTVPLTNAKNVSISPDGNFAAVGHETSVSYIDLTARTVVDTYNVGTTVFDVVLAGNGYAYIFPESGTYNTHVYSLNLSMGKVTITGGTSYYSKAVAKVHPSGSYIYSIERWSSPASITKYDISKGNASFLYASDHSYDFDNNLWFSESGDYLFARSADILQPSTDPATDLIPKSQLVQNDEEIVAMDHSTAADRLYAVFTSTEYLTDIPTAGVNVYNGTNFGYLETIAFPKYLIADNNGGGELVDAYANYGFFNSTGTEFYVITVDAETESSQAMITIPVN